MLKSIKARYREGRLEPLEPLALEEGAEITVTLVTEEKTPTAEDPTTGTAGAWEDLLDCERFEADVYHNRLVDPRPEVTL